MQKLTTQGKKLNESVRKQVIGVYLGCLNYNLTARLTGIAPNSVKNIIEREKKKNPKEWAKTLTKVYKKNNKLLERALEITQDDQFISASANLMNYPYRLNQYMNLQDRQLIERTKALYQAKTWALTYEAKRIERALKLKQYDKLSKLITQAKKDTKLYEPIDFVFLETPAFYGVNYHDNSITEEKLEKYIKQIEEDLAYKGYNIEETNIRDFIADANTFNNYYYR